MFVEEWLASLSQKHSKLEVQEAAGERGDLDHEAGGQAAWCRDKAEMNVS